MPVPTRFSHMCTRTDHPARLQMSLGQEASPDHSLSAWSQNSQDRRSNWLSLDELSAPGAVCPPLAGGQGHGGQACFAESGSQGKEIVSRGDTSNMPITLMLDLLKCTFLGPNQTLYKLAWGF